MSFAPGHKGMPVLAPAQAADPILRQVLTSRNVRGGRLLSAAMGGLNFQIEHHLFPSMPRPHLVRAQRVVRRFCDERGVSYAEVSVVATYAAVVRHLDAVGADLRAARAPAPAPADGVTDAPHGVRRARTVHAPCEVGQPVPRGAGHSTSQGAWTVRKAHAPARASITPRYSGGGGARPRGGLVAAHRLGELGGPWPAPWSRSRWVARAG